MVEDRVAVENLSRIAEDTPWEAFEAMPDGRLVLFDRAQTMLEDEEGVDRRGWVFDMRYGLHMNRAAQAIMSCGHFIRFRLRSDWENYALQKMDPSNPDASLYRTIGNPSWHPSGMTYQQFKDQCQQTLWAAQQAQLLQAQYPTYSGGGSGGMWTTTTYNPTITTSNTTPYTSNVGGLSGNATGLAGMFNTIKSSLGSLKI